MDTANEVKIRGLDAKIFMLVHDSIVAIVKDEDIPAFCEIMARNTQKDRGCSIKNCPVGIDVDIGQDYSFGHFEEEYRIVDGCLERVPKN